MSTHVCHPFMPSRQDPIAPSLVTASNGTPELARFFEDLEFLFDNCLIQSDAAKKKHTTRYLDTPTARLWQGLEPSYTAGSYEEWKTAVHTLYPGTSEDRVYSICDLDILVKSWSTHSIKTLAKLSEFYRQFLTVSSFLVSRQRLSVGERDRAFRTVFDAQQWTRIYERLTIMNIDHHPADPWPISSIFAAAQYLLYDTTPSIMLSFPPSRTTSSTTPAPTTILHSPPLNPVENLHVPNALHAQEPSVVDTKPFTLENKDIVDVFEQFLTRLEQLQPQDCQRREIKCYFCSGRSHRIQECPQVEPSIRAGKCRRNAAHRIVLPSGARIPNNISGCNLREKFDEYHCFNANTRDDNFGPINGTYGTFFCKMRVPHTPSPAAKSDSAQQNKFIEQVLLRLGAHGLANDVPAPVPIAARISAPVRNFKPINYPERLPTPPATIRPPPYSKPSTPRQPITIQALLIESARPVGRCTTVPTTTALPPTEPSPPFSPASLSPAVRSNPTLTSSLPSFGHPGLRVLVVASSFERTPVSSPLSIPVSSLLVPTALGKENGCQPTSYHMTTPAPDVSAGEPWRLPPVESLATVVAPANPVTPKAVAHAASHSTTTTPSPTFKESTMPTPVPASPASITTPVPTPAADRVTADTSTATIEQFTLAPFRAHRPATAAVPTTWTFEEPAPVPAAATAKPTREDKSTIAVATPSTLTSVPLAAAAAAVTPVLGATSTPTTAPAKTTVIAAAFDTTKPAHCTTAKTTPRECPQPIEHAKTISQDTPALPRTPKQTTPAAPAKSNAAGESTATQTTAAAYTVTIPAARRIKKPAEQAHHTTATTTPVPTSAAPISLTSAPYHLSAVERVTPVPPANNTAITTLSTVSLKPDPPIAHTAEPATPAISSTAALRKPTTTTPTGSAASSITTYAPCCPLPAEFKKPPLQATLAHSTTTMPSALEHCHCKYRYPVTPGATMPATSSTTDAIRPASVIASKPTLDEVPVSIASLKPAAATAITAATSITRPESTTFAVECTCPAATDPAASSTAQPSPATSAVEPIRPVAPRNYRHATMQPPPPLNQSLRHPPPVEPVKPAQQVTPVQSPARSPVNLRPHRATQHRIPTKSPPTSATPTAVRRKQRTPVRTQIQPTGTATLPQPPTPPTTSKMEATSPATSTAPAPAPICPTLVSAAKTVVPTASTGTLKPAASAVGTTIEPVDHVTTLESSSVAVCVAAASAFGFGIASSTAGSSHGGSTSKWDFRSRIPRLKISSTQPSCVDMHHPLRPILLVDLWR
ncbi:hypothetical protein H0H81_003290 [Sphagnurus paluster]|uniref:CCHC-type domain-containing protein n=1 Tax=Sphagnurus paluster TaxID=117069 RepID=A0A9P7FLV7_9AGAR|nr:hypothetical protein H0H81_003290 [Sphagnurus paluster]